ncbi:transmembrane signal receptor [Lithospermum erythrorhizon]|uniref:Transmembrane signal receptor n=1 Tax=Lithospermum erythrorhizon TaxID=34254 RepID=A0AAV3R7T9_LITER
MSVPVPEYLSDFSNLTKLGLSYCGLYGTFPTKILQIPILKHLDVSWNPLLQGSVPEFPRINSLKQLVLSSTNLSGNLPRSIGNLHQLEELDLSSCRFTTCLEGPLSNSFFELKSLVVLDLSFNRFNASIQLEAFWKLENLTNLDLSYNKIDLEDNNSTLLPAKIARLRLASCNLRNFPIQGNQSRYAIAFSCSPYQQSVSVLDLHSNMLNGSIPILPNSVYLDYSNNSFASMIPADIGNSLGLAVFFSASENCFSGNIPYSICQALNLQGLDLSHNNLNGAIPSCLFKLSSFLVILNLGGNKIQGQIPGNFTYDCVLQTFDLNGKCLKDSESL